MQTLAKLHLLVACAAILSACSKPAATEAGGAQIYQCPMHPWIQSDKPGNCTICGMKLVPASSASSAQAASAVNLSEASRRSLDVDTAPVTTGAIDRTLKLSGIIEDDDSRHRIISAYVPGRIDRLFVNYVGAEVVEGQPLASFYSPMLLNAEKEYRLAARSGADSTLAKNAVSKLRQLGLTEKQIEAVRQKPEGDIDTQILAPMTGTVVARDVYEGQYVEEGQRLFEIADFSTMWFMADVYERDLPLVRVGQKVAVTSPSLPVRTLEGTVAFIDPNFDAALRSTKARIEIANPRTGGPDSPRLISHRVYADGVISDSLGTGLVVPRSAVLDTGDRAIVYVETGPGNYQPRPVTIGRRGDSVTEIADGLREGERVVTRGAMLLDSEAQLHSIAPPSSTETSADPRLAEIFSIADRTSHALANDDLAAFNKLPLAKTAAELQALAPDAPKIPIPPEGPAKNLAEARSRALPFLEAAAGVALNLRKSGGTGLPTVYECPMTGSAFANAPGNARWLQTGGPMENPYLGPSMIDCGSEVQP